MFSCLLKIFDRNHNIYCAIIFLAALSDIVSAQSNITIVGQPQQQPSQNQTRQDKSLVVARSFGPDTKMNGQSQNPTQTVITSYPPTNVSSRTNQLPDNNLLQTKNVPDDQRRSGVWSLESHQNLMSRNQISQTPEPTLLQRPSISQPQYQEHQDNWTRIIPQPILQISGDASESEATLAVQSPPPLVPPMMNNAEIFVSVDTLEPMLQDADATNEAVSSTMPTRHESRDASPFLTPTENAKSVNEINSREVSGFGFQTSGNVASSMGEQNEVTSVNPESRNPESEVLPAKYSDRPMPEFYLPGEQKAEAADKRSKDGTFAFLPQSTGPTMTVLSSLAIVLGVFFVLVWLMKRATPRQGGLLPTEVFEKLGSVPLSPKMHLHLFRLGGKLVLVSLTPDGMEPVAEVTDPDEVIHLIGLCKQNDPKSASAAFRQVLKQYTGEKGQQYQQQMTGFQQQSNGYQQSMPQQQYPAQQYQQQQYAQQQAVRRPVGVVRR